MSGAVPSSSRAADRIPRLLVGKTGDNLEADTLGQGGRRGLAGQNGNCDIPPGQRRQGVLYDPGHTAGMQVKMADDDL